MVKYLVSYFDPDFDKTLLHFNSGVDRYDDQGEITSILQRAHHSRKAAENVGKHLLHKLDRSYNCGTPGGRSSPTKPWEDLSSTGKTTR